MPLHRGCGSAVRSRNIAEMRRSGHKGSQSAAAAYRFQREQGCAVPRRRNRLDPTQTISKAEYDVLLDRMVRYEQARKRFDPKRFQRGGGYSPEEIAVIERMAGGRNVTNEERALMETYQWMRDRPETAFVYYNDAMTEVSGFMGNKLGDIVSKGPEVRRMGGRTQSVRVRGTNGAYYHGICNKTGGTYCRLRKMKGR